MLLVEVEVYLSVPEWYLTCALSALTVSFLLWHTVAKWFLFLHWKHIFPQTGHWMEWCKCRACKCTIWGKRFKFDNILLYCFIWRVELNVRQWTLKLLCFETILSIALGKSPSERVKKIVVMSFQLKHEVVVQLEPWQNSVNWLEPGLVIWLGVVKYWIIIVCLAW